jgi:hypothetical protein
MAVFCRDNLGNRLSSHPRLCFPDFVSDSMTEPMTEPVTEPTDTPQTMQKKDRVGILFFQTFNLVGLLLSWAALAAVLFLLWLLFF